LEKYKKIVDSASPILALIQQGFSPREIKKAVIESLDPLFENKNVLEEIAIPELITQSMTIEKIRGDGRFVKVLTEIISIYRSALKQEPTKFFESLNLSEPMIAESDSKFWSILNLEVDKSKLALYEFTHECMRNIGDFTEDLAKPYLLSLLLQVRIINGTEFSANFTRLDLGEIVDELTRKTSFQCLLMPAPWNVRLNQWRNIARHGSSRIENNKIICQYGKPPDARELTLSRAELLMAVNTTYMTFLTLKSAYAIFFNDNIEQISKQVKFGVGREEIDFLPFAAGLASEGFEILDYDSSNEKAILTVKDCWNETEERKIHASQFLFTLWLFTHSRKLLIEYCGNSEVVTSVFAINGTVCEQYSRGDIDLAKLAEAVQRIDL
jgi:hypothetical protein